MSAKVTLTGHIIVANADLEIVMAALPEHIELTQDEPGCISFSVVQSPTSPNRFDVAEEFIDRDAFQKHQARVKSSHWGQVTVNVERKYRISENSEH